MDDPVANYASNQSVLTDINTLACWLVSQAAQEALDDNHVGHESLPNIRESDWNRVKEQARDLIKWFKPADPDKDAAYARLAQRADRVGK